MKIIKSKKLNKLAYGTACFLAALMFFSPSASFAAPSNSKQNLNVGLVNFKECIEQSKIGKQEQQTFEAMKKQMESILEDKEKALNEIAVKFNDPDYLDSLAPEAETEMKRKFRTQGQELQQQQQQYYQLLTQANYKIVQKLSDTITNASKEVAKEKNLDIVLNEESCFYCSPDLNISKFVIAKMDDSYDKEQKEKANQPQTTPQQLPALQK